MVAIKNSVVLVASLVTLSTAFPGFGPWQAPSGAPTGVAQGDHDGAGGSPGHEADKAAAHPPAYGKYPGADAHNAHDHPSRVPSGDHHDDHERGYGGRKQTAHSDSHPRDIHHEGPKAAPAGPTHGGHENEIMADSRFPHLHPTHEDGQLHSHEARGVTVLRGVYECANRNFVMPCIYTPVKEGQCYNRNYGPNGSMGPDKGLTCVLYEQRDCNDHNWNRARPFEWPGIPDYQASYLLTRHGFPDIGPSSYRCSYTAQKKAN